MINQDEHYALDAYIHEQTKQVQIVHIGETMRRKPAVEFHDLYVKARRKTSPNSAIGTFHTLYNTKVRRLRSTVRGEHVLATIQAYEDFYEKKGYTIIRPTTGRALRQPGEKPVKASKTPLEKPELRQSDYDLGYADGLARGQREMLDRVVLLRADTERFLQALDQMALEMKKLQAGQ
jgi:hypothetical protein